jgi:RNA polymerase sigma-70 factor (ECF subfamily)
MNVSEDTDLIHEKVLQFCNGDHEAFAHLFRLWQTEFYFYAFHFVQNDMESEDILSDSFEKMLTSSIDYRKEKFQEEGHNFKGFLKTVIKNKALDVLKSKKTRYRILEHLKYFMEKTTLNETLRTEQELYVAQILKPLDKREREMVVMRMQGFSIEEISEKFFVSKKTVSNIIASSKQKVRLVWDKNDPLSAI